MNGITCFCFHLELNLNLSIKGWELLKMFKRVSDQYFKIHKQINNLFDSMCFHRKWEPKRPWIH